jgi:hypothetical protein
MLLDLQNITQSYLIYEDIFELGLAGVYLPNYNYSINYAFGLHAGRHFVLLEYYLNHVDPNNLLENVINFIVEPHTKQQLKFAKFVLDQANYETCTEYLFQFGKLESIDFSIMLHERALFLKKDEKEGGQECAMIERKTKERRARIEKRKETEKQRKETEKMYDNLKGMPIIGDLTPYQIFLLRTTTVPVVPSVPPP